MGLKEFGGLGYSDLTAINQFNVQLIGTISVTLWLGFILYLILIFLQNTIGLRISTENEEVGLDQSSHSERAYWDQK